VDLRRAVTITASISAETMGAIGAVMVRGRRLRAFGRAALDQQPAAVTPRHQTRSGQQAVQRLVGLQAAAHAGRAQAGDQGRIEQDLDVGLGGEGGQGAGHRRAGGDVDAARRGRRDHGGRERGERQPAGERAATMTYVQNPRGSSTRQRPFLHCCVRQGQSPRRR
jgi:hypothetical protein